ncbi:alpha/beta fold hydrolase [Dyella dinghuensis]|nr:alpha/beta hydrolase [Dyella dinghuensis]
MAIEGNVVLADGRVMTYAEYGSPEGRPVFYFHGSPSSRLEPLLIGDEVFAQHGLRIIAPDRPGMGRSSFQPHRGFSNWPVDVLALAEVLKLDTFSLLGFSGGGAYVAACASQIPQRLRSSVIVSGAWRMDNHPSLATLPAINRLAWFLTKRSPMLLGVMLNNLAKGAGKDLAQLKRYLPPPDYDTFEVAGRYEVYGFTLREALRQGKKGVVWDMRMYAQQLDIRLQDIHTPLHVFHGARDANVPLALVKDTLATLPTATLVTYPHDGHISTLCNHFDEIAKSL